MGHSSTWPLARHRLASHSFRQCTKPCRGGYALGLRSCQLSRQHVASIPRTCRLTHLLHVGPWIGDSCRPLPHVLSLRIRGIHRFVQLRSPIILYVGGHESSCSASLSPSTLDEMYAPLCEFRNEIQLTVVSICMLVVSSSSAIYCVILPPLTLIALYSVVFPPLPSHASATKTASHFLSLSISSKLLVPSMLPPTFW